MKAIINWKLFFTLLCLSLLSVLCVLPYVLTLQGDLLKLAPIPLPLLFLIQLVQSLILFSVAIGFGLWFTKRNHFHLPLLNALLDRGDYRAVLKKLYKPSIFAGIAVAVAIFTLDSLFTGLGVAISTHQNYAPAWQKILAAFYGGITEEILMRLFLMSLFIWLGTKIIKSTSPLTPIIWLANILAAILFGLGHLPLTAALTALTPLVVARAIILNGLGGVVFGWLFWRRGLESAMLAHFTTDIFLLTLLPMIFT